jgi:hypothetical protein
MTMNNIIPFRQPFVIKRRNYACTDIVDRNGKVQAQLVSMEKGFRPNKTSPLFRRLENTYYQTPQKFMEAWRRGRNENVR